MAVAATKSSPTDVVTEMDRRAEELIRSRILAVRPDDAILGEEGGCVDTGSRVRLAGKGNAGANGGPPGDLYIVTEVDPHPVFERKGDNIYVKVPVTVTEAALGAKVEIPTLDGPSTIKIPPTAAAAQLHVAQPALSRNGRSS